MKKVAKGNRQSRNILENGRIIKHLGGPGESGVSTQGASSPVLVTDEIVESFEPPQESSNIKKVMLTSIGESPEVAKAKEEIGASVHGLWVENYAAQPGNTLKNGSIKPRMKPFSDDPEDTRQVDIANTPFSDLPPKWRGENAAAGEAAFDAVNESKTVSEVDMEKAASIVHDHWVERNKEDPWADKSLMVKYQDLPEVEKEKDRVHVRLAVKASIANGIFLKTTKLR